MLLNLVLEKTLESPLDCKEIQPVHHKGDQSWVFTGRTDAEAETPILWPPDAKNWFTGKDPGAGKDWRQEEKGMTKDEMVGWHHWLDGHGKLQGLMMHREAWRAAVHGVERVGLSLWTELISSVCESSQSPNSSYCLWFFFSSVWKYSWLVYWPCILPHF